jgi:hypothetical protein
MAQSVVIPIRYPSIRPLLLRTQAIGLRAPMPRSVTVGGSGSTVMAATAGEISGSSMKPVSVIVSAVSGASRAIREPWPAVEPAVNRNWERFIARTLAQITNPVAEGRED